MSRLKQFLTYVEKANEWIAKAVSWLIVLIILATSYEVVMRYIFKSPTIWSFEFNYLVFGIYFMLAGAYTYATGNHVNVDILYGRLNPRGRAFLDLLTAPLFFVFITVMLYQGCKFFWNSLQFHETLSSAWAPPIYPFKFIIPLAALMLFLQGLLKLIRNIQTIQTGSKEKT